jgi:hypothetical protein
MKKLFVLFSTILLSSASFAVEPQIKITSFSYSDDNSHVAEICGTISDMKTSPTFLQIIVDESTNQPARYNSLAGPDGNFCLTVTTFAGTALAKIL